MGALLTVVLCLTVTHQARASDWWCSSSAKLQLADESASTCTQLETVNGVLHWPEGSALVVEGGDCTACPTPDWDSDVEQSCDEYLPQVVVYQNDAAIDTVWHEVTGAPCGWVKKLMTDLQPGVYEVKADNSEAQWTWTVQHGPVSLGPEPDVIDETSPDSPTPHGEASSSSTAAADGCTAGPSSAPLTAWLVGLCLILAIRRRRTIVDR